MRMVKGGAEEAWYPRALPPFLRPRQEAEQLGPAAAPAAPAAPRHPCTFGKNCFENPPCRSSRAGCTGCGSMMDERDASCIAADMRLVGGSCSRCGFNGWPQSVALGYSQETAHHFNASNQRGRHSFSKSANRRAWGIFQTPSVGPISWGCDENSESPRIAGPTCPPMCRMPPTRIP